MVVCWQVAEAKGKIQVQRDMEGIDASNIVPAGRRRAAAAPVDYRYG